MQRQLMRLTVRWYYRNVYRPIALKAELLSDYPPTHFVTTVPWISVREALCQATALQMIAAHHGIERPRRHFDFLMGFTYGASYRRDFGFITVGTDPETGLIMAAPYLGLERRYLFTDDASLYLRALRSYLAQGYPIRVPLDMGALYGQTEALPHNEVLVGYDEGGFTYYEPVSRPPAPSQPGCLPAGAPGLYVTDARLLQAVEKESGLFSYPWRYPLVIFTSGPVHSDLTPVWEQNGQALVGGNRWGQVWGAAAIERQADEIERLGARFDPAQIELGLEVGAATRPDNATYLRERFDDQSDLQQAADHFDCAACHYQAALDTVRQGDSGSAVAANLASQLRQAAAAERAAGQIFLARSNKGRVTR